MFINRRIKQFHIFIIVTTAWSGLTVFILCYRYQKNQERDPHLTLEGKKTTGYSRRKNSGIMNAFIILIVTYAIYGYKQCKCLY